MGVLMFSIIAFTTKMIGFRFLLVDSQVGLFIIASRAYLQLSQMSLKRIFVVKTVVCFRSEWNNTCFLEESHIRATINSNR